MIDILLGSPHMDIRLSVVDQLYQLCQTINTGGKGDKEGEGGRGTGEGREWGEEAGMTRRERVEGAGERGGSGGRRLGRGKGGSGEVVGEWEEEAGERGGMLRTKEHLMCVQVVSGREE